MSKHTKLSTQGRSAIDGAVLGNRERRRGFNGETADEFFANGLAMYLMAAQQSIAAGTKGSMNILAGPKGGEADQGLTVQEVLSRFVALTNGQQAIVAGFDRGFEVVHVLQNGSGGGNQPCNCKKCVQDQPRYWTFSTSFNSYQTYALIGPDGGPWTSPPFSWGGANTNLTWTLTAPGSYGLLKLNGFSDGGIQFRCPDWLWAPQCANTMTLWNPTSQAASNAPCTVCVIPSDRTVGGNCPDCPQSGSFTFSAQQAQALFTAAGPALASNIFKGDFEIPLSRAGTDATGIYCTGTIQIGTTTPAYGNQPVNLTLSRAFAGGTPPSGCNIGVSCNLPNATLYSLSDNTAACSGPVTLNGTNAYGAATGTLVVTFS